MTCSFREPPDSICLNTTPNHVSLVGVDLMPVGRVGGYHELRFPHTQQVASLLRRRAVYQQISFEVQSNPEVMSS
jgi:hypothetical protein